MRKLMTSLGTLLLVVAIATPVFARAQDQRKGMPPRGRGGPERGTLSREQGRPIKGAFANLTEEQRGQLAELRQKFFDDTAQLRTQIVSKRAELKILLNTSNPDLEKVKAVQKEISELGATMAQKKIDFLFEARKISPDLPFGRGSSHHMRDFGHGKSRGGPVKGRR